MKASIKRMFIASCAAFFSYKALIAALADAIPGQPFYSFSAAEWLYWLIEPGEIGLVIAAIVTGYCTAFLMLKKLRAYGVHAWGACIGLFIGAFFGPFDVSSKLEGWLGGQMAQEPAFNHSLAALILVAYIFAVPLLVAWILTLLPGGGLAFVKI